MYGIEPNKGGGSFRIWYKATEAFELGAVISGKDGDISQKIIRQLHFRWWAYSGMDAVPKDTRAKTLTLRPRRLTLQKEAATADFSVFYQDNLLGASSSRPSWKIYDKSYKYLQTVNNTDVKAEAHTAGGTVFRLDVAKCFKKDVYDFIVECRYNGADAIAYVKIDRKLPYHHIEMLSPPDPDMGGYINLIEEDPFTIKWSYISGVEYYKINIRRASTSAIIFSETVPGNCTSVKLRRQYLCFVDAGWVQCALDIFAYFSPTDCQHRDYPLYIQIN